MTTALHHLKAICLLCVLFAATAAAQSSATSQAESIVEDLTARSSLPPIAAQAKLDIANADVCRALGEELKELGVHDVKRIVRYLSQSQNELARATLLFGLTSEHAEVVAVALQALTSLEFNDIIRIRGAAERLDSSLLQTLASEEYVNSAVRQRVMDLCSQEAGLSEDEMSRHRAIALALLADVYGGPEGAKNLMKVLLELLVGSEPPEDLAKLFGRELEEEAEGEISHEEIEDPRSMLEERRRRDYRLMNLRREQAQQMYKELFLRDSNDDQLGKVEYELRQRAAKHYWENYEDLTGEAFSTWRQHILWALRDRGSEYESFLLINRLLGSVEIPLDDAGDAERLIPIVEGDVKSERIGHLNGLEKRELLRRKRFLKRKFLDAFAATGERSEE